MSEPNVSLRTSLIHNSKTQGTGTISLARGTPGFYGMKKPACQNQSTFCVHGEPDRYPDPLGHPRLRQLVSRQFSRTIGSSVAADDVLITNGATNALDLIFREAGFRMQGGFRVAMVTPTWCVLPCNQIRLAGGTVDEIPTIHEENGWYLDLVAARRALQESDLLFVVLPNNPTGSLFEDQINELLEMAFKSAVCCILDLTYSEFIYGNQSCLAIPDLKMHRDYLYLVNSLSKTFGIPGLRIGALVAPYRVSKGIETVFQANVMGVANTCQSIATDALVSWESTSGGWFKEVKRELEMRRDLTCNVLHRHRFSFVSPAAGYYVFAAIPASLDFSGTEFAERLRDDEGVSVVAGSDFDTSGQYSNYIRLSYANPQTTDQLRVALDRIGKFVESHRA